jgi:hypothetical protein
MAETPEAGMTVSYRIEIESEDEADELLQEIQGAGAEASVEAGGGEDADAIVPILIVLASVGAASVIADYILRTGRIIDLTKDPIVIKRDRNLERNEVLFIVEGEGGKKTYELKDAPKSDLVKIIDGGVKDVVDAILGAGGKAVP